MLFLTLVVVEICFRLYSSVSIIYDVEMHKYAKKLKQKSSIGGLSHEHIPNKEALLMGVKINLNDQGYREDVSSERKKNNEKRIVFVGSSITMGWGVEYDSVFTTKLEKYLKKNIDSNFNVLNTGVGNYNSNLESIFVLNKIKELEADELVLHYFINDAEELPKGTNNFFIKNFYSVAYFYIRVKQAINANKNNYSSIGEYYFDLYDDSSDGWMSAKESILKIKEVCEKNQINFSVLIQPDLHNLKDDSFQKSCHEKIKKFLDYENIKYLDLFDSFQKKIITNPSAIWVNHDDPHPNFYGHDIIYKSLIENVNF